MRKPTSKERHVMQTAFSGLTSDVGLITDEESLALAERQGIPYADILGTLETNLKVLQSIHKRLRDEND